MPLTASAIAINVSDLMESNLHRSLYTQFTAFDPRRWLSMARALRTSQGWVPPMMLIAVCGTVGFGGAFIRSSQLLTALLYAWALCWTIIFAISSSFVLFDSLRNITRFGMRAFTRSRFWFELSRSSCILGVMAAIAALLVGYLDRPVLAVLGELTLRAILPCFVTFCVASTIGYAVKLATRQRPTGRALECVNFFFPQCLAGLLIFGLLLSLGPRLNDPLVYGTALGILIGVCLLAAVALALVKRWRSQPPDMAKA